MPMSLFLATDCVDRDVVPFVLILHRIREGGTILRNVCHGVPSVQHKQPCQYAVTFLKRSHHKAVVVPTHAQECSP